MWAYLDVEIGRVAEHSPNSLRLRLHVHLLDLSRLERLVAVLRILGKCGGKRSFRRLQSGTGQHRGHLDARVTFVCGYDGLLYRWRWTECARELRGLMLCARKRVVE